MQKLEKKVEDWSILRSTQVKPSASPRLAASSRLAQRRPTEKPKGTLSVKARAKREVA